MRLSEKQHTKNIWYTKNLKVINSNCKWLQLSFYHFLNKQAKIKNQWNLGKKKEKRNGNLLVEHEQSRIVGEWFLWFSSELDFWKVIVFLCHLTSWARAQKIRLNHWYMSREHGPICFINLKLYLVKTKTIEQNKIGPKK